jgi:hypothetical protein
MAGYSAIAFGVWCLDAQDLGMKLMFGKTSEVEVPFPHFIQAHPPPLATLSALSQL